MARESEVHEEALRSDKARGGVSDDIYTQLSSAFITANTIVLFTNSQYPPPNSLIGSQFVCVEFRRKFYFRWASIRTRTYRNLLYHSVFNQRPHFQPARESSGDRPIGIIGRASPSYISGLSSWDARTT